MVVISTCTGYLPWHPNMFDSVSLASTSQTFSLPFDFSEPLPTLPSAKHVPVPPRTCPRQLPLECFPWSLP